MLEYERVVDNVRHEYKVRNLRMKKNRNVDIGITLQ